MIEADLISRLEFIRRAEPLKDTLRSAHTAQGNTESVAEHTWRLVLLAITFADLYPELDLLKLLKICAIHDLGEVVHGDIPAPLQTTDKSHDEREDYQSLLTNLPQHIQQDFLALWDEYNAAKTDEAKMAKALDKLETILQHNQGSNPVNFDYAYNLHYGKNHTDATQLTSALRSLVDRDTERHHNKQHAFTKNTASDELTSIELKAFIPAPDFVQATRFYTDLGFQIRSNSHGVAYFMHGNCSFLLQQTDWDTANNLTMHLLVKDVDKWYQHVVNNDIPETYHVELSKMVDQPWGMREFIIFDPNQVQWRIAQNI